MKARLDLEVLKQFTGLGVKEANFLGLVSLNFEETSSGSCYRCEKLVRQLRGESLHLQFVKNYLNSWA